LWWLVITGSGSKNEKGADPARGSGARVRSGCRLEC
jgi:hypothetical protein